MEFHPSYARAVVRASGASEESSPMPSGGVVAPEAPIAFIPASRPIRHCAPVGVLRLINFGAPREIRAAGFRHDVGRFLVPEGGWTRTKPRAFRRPASPLRFEGASRNPSSATRFRAARDVIESPLAIIRADTNGRDMTNSISLGGF
jgi:hypothetical protein